MKKNIKVILINPETKTITEAMIEPNLQGFYATIGCEMVEASYPASLAKKGSFLYIDEEGRLKDNYYFSFEGQEYAGTAIVIGGIYNENEKETKLTVEEVAQGVQWLDKKEAGYGVYVEVY